MPSNTLGTEKIISMECIFTFEGDCEAGYPDRPRTLVQATSVQNMDDQKVL